MGLLRGLALVGSAAAVTPVQKVIQMLEEMAAKGKEEIQKEKIAFSKFNQWCDDTNASKSNDLKNAQASAEQADATIAKAEADADALSRSIEALNADLASYNADLDAATKVRDQERSDFQAQKTDYEESIDAVGRAIGILKQQNFDRKQAEKSLLQLNKVSQAEKAKLVSLIQQNPEGTEANAYEFQSSGVVGMLETLEDKFVKELRDLQTEETNSVHAYNMLKQTLTDQIKNATKQRDSEEIQVQKKKTIAGNAKAELADANAAIKANTEYLADLKTECEMKNREFESRQKLRAEEIVAINKAVEIIGGEAVSGGSEKYLPQLIQKGTSFIQISSGNPEKAQKVAEFLQNRAAKLSSKVLVLMANRVEANPFAKVTKMISDLIIKLKNEATAEEEKHGWCQTELAANKQTRDNKTKDSNELTAEIEGLQSKIAQQTEKINTLNESIAESDRAVREASAQRAEDHAENEQTVKDAKAAQQAVTSALTVLKEFYNKAAGATALVQQPSADAPKTFDSPYKGMQGESGGVIGMLEVIQSDFVRLETETAAEEAEAARSHQKFLDDSAEDKAVAEAEVQGTTTRRTRNETNLNEAKRELAAVTEELKAANDYYETLRPDCVGDTVSAADRYAERVAKREEEIAALKEALQIFESHGDE